MGRPLPERTYRVRTLNATGRRFTALPITARVVVEALDGGAGG